MTILLALASSLLWGVADFFGGKTSRRVLALLVVLISQAAGLVAALITAAASDSFAAPAGYLPWAMGAGLAGASAVVLFYRALAIGTMGVVAPLASLGVIVPVVIGLFGGSLPSVLCLAGIVVAIGGVVTTAGPSRSAARTSRHARSVLLAIGAAVGFGLLQFAISGGSKYSVVMTMVAMRGTSVPLLAVIALIALRAPSGHPDRHPVSLHPRLLGLIAVIGIFDVSANLLFGRATVSGSLAIVAVLGSLYPATTVLLARLVDGERMSRVQNAGVLAALAGVAMIAAGS
ncbi:MAG: EamA family transporter [Streptosporangiaceae bacterium]